MQTMSRVDRPSVFEFVGGSATFLALATAHHERCLAHPVLNHPFSHGGHPDHIQRLADYWAEVFGGPPTFTESCGGQPGMLGIHWGNGEGHEKELGDGFLECFLAAIDDVGISQDPELRATLSAYMEWAVADVTAYASRNTTVPADVSVPRWSWDGLQQRS